jgi:hypothetical protein
VGGHPCFWAENEGGECGNVGQSWKTCGKGRGNLRKVVRRRSNKLEKVFEKCERLVGKMGEK